MDTSITAIEFDSSLFDVIQEIEKRDYIVVKDNNDGILGIVTASDLANRFERFSRAFAYIGEIDLLLRTLFKNEGILLASHKRVPGFTEYINELKDKPHVLRALSNPQQFIRNIKRVKLIRDRVMHFKNGNLDEASAEDITLLRYVLSKIKSLA